MRERSNTARLQRILDRLDERLDVQTMLPSAATLLAVPFVDQYHNTAGFIERRILPFADDMSACEVASFVARLLLILREHRSAAVVPFLRTVRP